MPKRISSITPNQAVSLIILLSVGLVMIVLMSMILPLEMIADELYHLSQIMLFKSSNYLIIPELTMPPTYHLAVGELAKVFGVDSFPGIRIVSASISYMAVILVWIYLNIEKSSLPFLQSLQILFSPLLWPVYWVLYTDIPSLIAILLSLIFLVQQRYIVSAVFCLISLCFRQHNIFWVLLLWLIAIDQSGCWIKLLKVFEKSHTAFFQKMIDAVCHCLASTSIYLLPIICFIMFMYVNDGIALGDRQSQTFGGLYPLQIFSCLFVLGLVLLPLHISNIFQIICTLRRHYWLIILIGALFIFYMKTFKIVHPHNFPSDYFLRNWLLYFLDGHFRYKVAAFGLIALALLSLIVTPLRSNASYWLYPVTILSLMPVSLIEQRYYIVPYTLLMLFRKPKGLPTEISLLIWFAILSLAITYGMVTMRFFI
jgi:alpha-1,2-glucosyltransferase